MRIILLGPPGVGKGTQASRLASHHGVVRLGTGDMLRTAVAGGSPFELEVKSYMDSGGLVPDTIIIGIMRDRLAWPDAKDGYILDGFPRTVNQAIALDRFLSEHQQKIDYAFNLAVDEEILIDRISGRRSCPSCHRVYHITYDPPKQTGMCDCRTPLMQRKDDSLGVVRQRLQVYQREAEPLVQFYKQQGILMDINAGGAIDEVTEKLKLS